ncbi:MAG: PEGA domain-containing protein [Acidobacteriota bacterium]
MSRYSPNRQRAAGCLRIIAGLALLVLALAVFWRPLNLVLGPKIAPTVQQLDLPRVWRPAPAQGFLVRITSDPSAAQVRLDGAERGSTPLFANVACEAGQPISIVIEKPGLPAWQRTVPCRVGKELTVRARLRGD